MLNEFTIEQAIFCLMALRNHISEMGGMALSEPFVKALEVAVEALERETENADES